MLPRSERNKKNGAPKSAVIIPTGSSAGARTIRANVSHSDKKVAPQTAERNVSGNPDEKRGKDLFTKWGTIKPTNPTAPQTKVEKESARLTVKRSKKDRVLTLTPKVLAIKGPLIKKVRVGARANKKIIDSTMGAAIILTSFQALPEKVPKIAV